MEQKKITVELTKEQLDRLKEFVSEEIDKMYMAGAGDPVFISIIRALKKATE